MSKLVSTAQITLTDQNDYIFTSSIPPANPITGLTLWIDTSITPNHLKRWNGYDWEIVNDVKIGGTNLLPNSSFEDKINLWTVHGPDVVQSVTGGYDGGLCIYIPGAGQVNAGLYLPHVTCETGQVYTFSCMVKVVSVGIRVSLGWRDSYNSSIQGQLASLPLNTWRKVNVTFMGDGSTAPIYLISTGYNLYIDHVKLEKGNTATDWSPSPHDTIKIAGRNLLINSGMPITSSAYLVKEYQVTSLSVNEKYTIVIKAIVAIGQMLGVYWNGGFNLAKIFNRQEGESLYYAHITSPNSLTSNSLWVYNLPNSGAQMTIKFACLYEGHISPPIDWSPAPEDMLLQLNDISDDNKLTPDEKQRALKEWESIQSEVSPIRTQADLFKVSRTIYDAVYSTLHSYITPLLSNLTTTSDIVGSTFRSRFNEYYTARTNLLLAISKQQMDNVDNIIVGGENLYNDSKELYVWSPGGSTPTIARNTTNTPNGFEFLSSDGGNGVDVRISNVIHGNGYYVVSFWAKVISGTHSINVDLADNFAGSFVLNTSWKRIEAIANVQNYTQTIYHFVDISTSSYMTCYVKDFQVQRGNKSTEYRKSTEFITQAIQGSTDINGGLVATHLLMLKNNSNSVTSGVSGLSSDNIGFWSGGTYSEALNGSANTLIRKDGSGHFAGGNINWDVSGNIAFRGFVDAIGGRIGGMTIQQNSLATLNLSFSDTPVESIASLLSPSTAYFYYQSTWFNSDMNTAHAYTQQLYLTIDAQISFKVTTTSDGDAKRWRVEIINPDSQIVFADTGIGVITKKLYTINLRAGSYVLHAYSTSSAIIPLIALNSALIEGAFQSDLLQATGFVNQTKIGNNGLYSFWSNQLYLYFSSQTGFELKGPTNMPGVLASGSIESSGAHTNYWGAKINTSNASYTATGIYDVPHRAGSVYQVMIQPTIDNVRAVVTSKGYNTFRVQLRTNSGSATLGSFDYVIFGDN